PGGGRGSDARAEHGWRLNVWRGCQRSRAGRVDNVQRIAKDLTCQATNPCLERSRETSFTGAGDEVSRLRSRHEGIPGGPTSLHTAVVAAPMSVPAPCAVHPALSSRGWTPPCTHLARVEGLRAASGTARGVQTAPGQRDP